MRAGLLVVSLVILTGTPGCNLREVVLPSSTVPRSTWDDLWKPGDDVPSGDEDGGTRTDMGEGELPAKDCSNSYCGNGYCILECGESEETCPEDCCLFPDCGDEICQDTGNCAESIAVCPEDCCLCGDGLCDMGEEGCAENAALCPEDCCATACGDGLCEQEQCGESGLICPEDCCACGDGLCQQEQCGESSSNCPEDCCSCGDGLCQPECGEAWNEEKQTCALDCTVCGNDVCEPGEGPVACPMDCCGACGDGQCMGGCCGEDEGTCIVDCAGSTCGDGECDQSENPALCPADCDEDECGNGVCEPGESAQSCHDDCLGACGDCTCGNMESFATCPEDCGYCGDGYCYDECPHLFEDAVSCPPDCCVPDCSGKQCGGDGCGGSCGNCPTDLGCVGGKCQCIPACIGKECGPDGCSGNCGVCPEDHHCSADGKCKPGPCQPQCADKDCGLDGCGGLCGNCNDGTWCTQDVCDDGQCLYPIISMHCLIDEICRPMGITAPGEPCLHCDPALSQEKWSPLEDQTQCGFGNVCVAGECCDHAAHCVGLTCGDDGCGGNCGECDEPWFCDGGNCTCLPKCDGVECGDDGCGGSCGECNDDLWCTVGFCAEGNCQFELQDWFCLIDEECVPAGAENPDNPCLECAPLGDTSQWSPVMDTLPCGFGMHCFDGFCCPHELNCLGMECGDDGCGGDCGQCDDDLWCTAQICNDGLCLFQALPGYCAVDSLCLAGGAWNEENHCLFCNPEENAFEWSSKEEGEPCGPGHLCYQGECCDHDANCDDKMCGDDGCGETCGQCPPPSQCIDGQCHCEPDCENKACGDDGCGETCGQCPPPSQCIDGQCHCEPDCENKACGDDGCGESCGQCPPPSQCIDGQCL